MRTAVVSSVVLHVTVIGLTAVVLPHSVYQPVELPPVLPVELLTIAEETNIAPAVEEQKTETPGPEAPAAPDPEVKPEAPPPPPPKPAEPESAPEPEPEPAPAEPEPAPPPLEEMKELEPVEPEPEPEPAPITAEDVQKALPAVKPMVPPQADKKASKDDLNFDEIAALIDKAPRKDKPRQFHQRHDTGQPEEKSERGRAAAGMQTGLSLSEIDAIRAQMKPCWRPPTGAPNAGELIVVLRVRFNPDGAVNGVPDVLQPGRGSTNSYLLAAADRAVTAVLQCQPYNLPVERYSSWQVSEISFDPRFLLGR